MGPLLPLAVEHLYVILFERGSCPRLVSINHPWCRCRTAHGNISSRSSCNIVFSLGPALISSTLIFSNEGEQMKLF